MPEYSLYIERRYYEEAKRKGVDLPAPVSGANNYYTIWIKDREQLQKIVDELKRIGVPHLVKALYRARYPT